MLPGEIAGAEVMLCRLGKIPAAEPDIAKVPIMIETISGFARNFPYKKPEFWTNYDKRPEALAHFEALAKRGKALPSFKADGPDKKLADQEYQKGELARSIKYLREVVGLGMKA